MCTKVYGFTHSPWVQAVLLALYDKELEYDLHIRPPYDVLVHFKDGSTKVYAEIRK